MCAPQSDGSSESSHSFSTCDFRMKKQMNCKIVTHRNHKHFINIELDVGLYLSRLARIYEVCIYTYIMFV